MQSHRRDIRDTRLAQLRPMREDASSSSTPRAASWSMRKALDLYLRDDRSFVADRRVVGRAGGMDVLDGSPFLLIS